MKGLLLAHRTDSFPAISSRFEFQTFSNPTNFMFLAKERLLEFDAKYVKSSHLRFLETAM
jgi:hypothetical protein